MRTPILGLSLILLSWTGAVAAEIASETRLHGRVIDARTGQGLPARLDVRDSSGEVVASYYEHCPGVFTDEDGRFELALPAGRYVVEAHHGIDYLSQRLEVEAGGEPLAIALEPWVPLRELGWVNGDGHAHLYTDKRPDDDMAALVRRICRAQAVDFIAANQGWSGYDESNWREGYARFSDDRFLLHYGAEMPKYRTGHTWWLGLTSCRGGYDAAMDRVYEDRYYQTEQPQSWTFEELPFEAVPDVELVPRLKAAEDAVALMPHPTSWWWQRRGEVEKYVTNVAGYLSFGLLAGGLWDGLVVMGYDRDHYFYQNLWFHVLDEGYRMPPVAELDGGFEPGGEFYYGSMRTYFDTGGELSMDAVVDALRAGRTLVTAGPIVFAEVDGEHPVGSVIPADGRPHTLRIDARAAGDRDDHLSYLLVFRNGRIHRLWDLRDERPRRVERELSLVEEARAWYVIKAYGRKAPSDPRVLDVARVCDQVVAGRFEGGVEAEAQVALTSPFYFRPPGDLGPQALEARIRLQIVNEAGQPVGGGRAHVVVAGERIASVEAADGRAELSMPITAILEIEAPGRPLLRKSLYLDYRPHRDLLERLASGRWLKQWPHLTPGQVPWQAFGFEETRAVLSDVDWTISY